MLLSRLFLTVDPRYGELSRPMRNRGVEIYLDKGDQGDQAEFGQVASISCPPRLLTRNSAAFNVNIYCQLLR